MPPIRAHNGWQIYHWTDRCIELRKEDAHFRELFGRDGYVRVRGEPGLDPYILYQRALKQCEADDNKVAQIRGAQTILRNVRGYQFQQKRYATAFATPQDPERIGRKKL